MLGAYYQEAMVMKSLKMQTVSRCKRRTTLYGPANISVPIQRRIVPSMEIRVHSRLFLARYKVALMQGGYYQQAMGMKSFKM